MRAGEPADSNDSNHEICKDVTAGSKVAYCAFLGIKRIPAQALNAVAKSGVWGTKIIASATGGLCKYYEGKPANEAVGMAFFDLGLSILFFPYRVFTVSAVLLEYGGRFTGCETAENTGAAMQKLLGEFKENILFSLPTLSICIPSAPIGMPEDQRVEHLMRYSLGRIKSSEAPINRAFDDCINALVDNYHWEPEIAERFNILLAAHLSEHLVYNHETKTVVFAESSASSTSNEMPTLTIEENDALRTRIFQIYDEAMSKTEEGLSESFGEYFSAVMIQETVDQHSESPLHALLHEAAKKIELTTKVDPKTEIAILYKNLQEVKDILHDGALLANICGRPQLAKSLSTGATGIERFVSGMTKLSDQKNNSFLSVISGTLSLFTGVAGVISGVVSAIQSLSSNNQLTELQQIEKQLDHLDEKLNCIIKNQVAIAKALGAIFQKIDAIGARLENFEKTTNKQLRYLLFKDLKDAVLTAQMHLKKESIAPISTEKLYEALQTMQKWLCVDSHLPEMNGAIHAGVMRQDAVDLLSSPDIFALTNLLGFIVKRLQLAGIAMPNKFLVLPPMELYLAVAQTLYATLDSLNISGNTEGRRVVSKELQDTYSLFMEFIQFVNENDQLQRRLQQWYINKRIEFLHRLYAINPSGNVPLSQALSTYHRNEIYELLNSMEEARLVLSVLNQWTGRLGEFDIGSKAEYLKATFDQIEYHSTRHSWIIFFEDTSGARSWILSSRPYEYHPCGKMLDGNMLINWSGYSNEIGSFFKNVPSDIVKFFFKHSLFEFVLLHFAASTGSTFVYNSEGRTTYDPRAFLTDRFVHLELAFYKKDKNLYATELMVLQSVFANNKLNQFRIAYQFYVACFNHNSAAENTLRTQVDAMCLLWLVAILGRYDIFESLPPPKDFDFCGKITEEKSVKYCLFSGVAMKNIPYSIKFQPAIVPIMLAAKWNRWDVIEGLLRERRAEGKHIGLSRCRSHLFGPENTAAAIALNWNHYQMAKLLDDRYPILSREQREEMTKGLSENQAAQEVHAHLINAVAHGRQVADLIAPTTPGVTTQTL